MLSKLRNDVWADRISICSTATTTEYDQIACAASTLIAKKLPARALPNDMRLISDVRLVDNLRDVAIIQLAKIRP